MGQHSILQQREYSGSYTRILFVGCSSAPNTIAPDLLPHKLSRLSGPELTCRWITDFLKDRKENMRLGVAKKIQEEPTGSFIPRSPWV